MFAALDLHKTSIQAVMKDGSGGMVKEGKLQRNAESVISFLGNTNATIVMESGYNHQHICDLLREKGYSVKVAHPFMVKAIAYASVKTDRVDARVLADLLRANMIPECYVPTMEVREVRDLSRRRHYFVSERTRFKNKIHAELDRRWIDCSSSLFTAKGREYLRSLNIEAVNDYLDAIEFLNRKISELDREIEAAAGSDRYARLLITIPGVSHYSALLISAEIADINRFPDEEHLCSYARLAPAVRQSADKRYLTPNRRGSGMLNWILIQCAHTHVRTCNSSITRHYNKLRERKGVKVATVAAARKLLCAVYFMLKEDRPFRMDG